MLKVLVTGGEGQLGRCIKDNEYLYKDDINFVFTDYMELDITNFNQTNAFFQKHQFDYCINCAAYTAVDLAENESDKAFSINAEGVKNLAEACNEHEVVLIHISTDFVFDGQKNSPYDEFDIANPINVYGASKLQGENEIRKTLNKYFIIRTSWLYSEHGNNFMKTMLRLGDSKDEISVVSDQIGTPTYAGDLADALLVMIESNSQHYGIYHFSNLGIASWYDFAKRIFKETKVNIKVKPITTKDYPTLAKRPSYSVLDKTLMQNTFKINILNWEESLSRAILKLNKLNSAHKDT